MTQAEEIEIAYQNWASLNFKYHCSAGYYDRSHGDNIALGKRWAKLIRLIEAAGLDIPTTLSKLSSQ